MIDDDGHERLVTADLIQLAVFLPHGELAMAAPPLMIERRLRKPRTRVYHLEETRP